MSYSFHVSAATKAEAKQKMAAEFDNVVSSQPNHKADRDAAQAAANAFVDVIAEPHEGDMVNVSVSGSLSWTGDNEFTSANVYVTASLKSKA